jgi:putative ABC transport system permease protein
LGLAILLQSAPANIARLDAVRIDGLALAFALSVSVAATVLAGLLPAWQGSRAAAAALRDRSAAALGGGQRLRSLLVAAEIALSVVLLVGAGLMVRNFDALNRTDPGFVADGVLSFQVNLPLQRYPDFAQRREFIYAFQQRLARLPGIEQAGAATPLPLTGQPFNGRYASQAPAGDDTAYRQANYRIVLPGYFETMQTPLLAGRQLNRDDEVNEQRVVVVDDVMAATAWPGESPLGKQVWLRLNQPDPIPFEVVGVIRRQLQDNLHEPPRETVYFTAGGAGLAGANGWVVRASGRLDALLPLIRRELAAMDPTLPLANVQTMDGYLTAATQRARFALQLIGAFAAVALLIALVALYVAIQSLVTQRRAEIGLRMSMGARGSDVFRHFVGRGLILAIVGTAVGLIAATAFAQAMRGFLVKVSPTDWATYAVIAFVFLVIALFASAVPALRAARISPMSALRDN